MNTLAKDLIKGVAVGLFASWIKSLAEPPLQKIGEKKFPPTPQELEIKVQMLPTIPRICHRLF
ncbi:MAG: hypothetical protein L0G16_02625 [Weeksellaceae bacterium]|nr:hypothetical protein [Weeksellaceae bacterium]